MLQGHVDPPYDAPIVAKATHLKTAPPNPTEPRKGAATAMDPTKPGLATVQPEREKSIAFEASTPKSPNSMKLLQKLPPPSQISQDLHTA